MEFIKLKKEIYEKNAKNRMKVSLAVKLFSMSQLQCILRYGPNLTHKIPLEHWDSCINFIYKTNRWINVMNGSSKHGCEPVDNADHPHVFELLSYASYLDQWRRAVHPSNFLPISTYEDCVSTLLAVVLTTRIYLKRWSDTGYPVEKIMQRRHGTDDCEKLFCKSRGNNPGADAKGTRHSCVGNINCMTALALSKKANCSRSNKLHTREVAESKVARKILKRSYS